MVHRGAGQASGQGRRVKIGAGRRPGMRARAVHSIFQWRALTPPCPVRPPLCGRPRTRTALPRQGWGEKKFALSFCRRKMRVGTANPLFFCRGALSAGIATAPVDQSTVWHVLHFVLTEEPCCAALQASDSNSKVLQATTNSSTQHGRNTGFPASFASEWYSDTIGLVVLLVALAALFITAKLSWCRKC